MFNNREHAGLDFTFNICCYSSTSESLNYRQNQINMFEKNEKKERKKNTR